MKMLPVFLPDQGIDLTKVEQFLLNTFSPYTRNMMYYNQELQGRLGFVKFDNYKFPDPITFGTAFKKLDGTYTQIIGTKRDMAQYDPGNRKWIFLTPQYVVGTVEVQAGTTKILRGSGTLWLANMKAGDFVKLGAGTVDSSATWYEVDTVDSDTQATMKTAMPTTGAGANYVLRKTYQAEETTLWSHTQFYDINKGVILVVTNGIDLPQYYEDGADSFKDITGLSAISVTAAKYVSQFAGRIIFCWTVEDGTNEPIRMRWSDVGNAFSYPGINYNDLTQPDQASWITGIQTYNDYFVVLKQYGGAYLINSIDSPSDFSFSFLSIFFGNIAFHSTMNILGKIFYFGADDRFRVASMFSDEAGFEPIAPYTRNVDPNGALNVFGYQLKYLDQIRWILPYDSINNVQPVIYFNYKYNIIQIWEYEHPVGFNIIMDYINSQNLYVDDPVWGPLYVDETIGFWDDQKFLSGAPVTLYGGRDGYVYQSDVGTDDDGLPYSRTYDSSRLDFGMPDYRKRIWKQVPFLRSQSSGTVTVSWAVDDGDFDPNTRTITLSDATRDIIKPQITIDKEFENIKFRYTAQNHFSLIGYMNWISKKKKVVT